MSKIYFREKKKEKKEKNRVNRNKGLRERKMRKHFYKKAKRHEGKKKGKQWAAYCV